MCTATSRGSGTFFVTIKSTGQRFAVRRGESILDAALRCGIAFAHGCRAGVCGVCMAQILEGRIDYPDGPPLALFEEDVEGGKGLCCVGHASSDLILEPCETVLDWEPWNE